MTPECEALHLGAQPIQSAHTIEILRQIRNICRDGFSFDNNEISPEQQEAWWTRNLGKVMGWLYCTDTDVVGYGLLRLEDGRWYSSVAVIPAMAGRGYGGAITADLVRRSPVATWASARLDNPAAMRLHRADDWDEYRRDERLAYYRTKEHVYS